MRQIFILIIIIIIQIPVSNGQQTDLRFDKISRNQGLSQSEVNSICQDSDGFIWIGTLDGLNKFDGYNITVYRKNSDILNCISNNFIQSIFEDNHGKLWIGTYGGGINIYDKDKDEFISYTHDNNNPKSISDDYINCIYQLKNGDILFGSRKGLIVLDSNNTESGNPAFMNYFDFEINSVAEDNTGIIWLATWQGLYKVIFDKNRIPHIIDQYLNDPKTKGSIISNSILSVFKDKERTLWVGTDNGLDLLSPDQLPNEKNIRFQHFQYKENCKNCLPNNQVLTIHEDKSGKMWIGTRGGGLCSFNKVKKEFRTYTAIKNSPLSLSNNSIKCLYEDRTGILWIGTLGGGVNKTDLLRKQFSNYRITSEDNTPTPSNFIRAIYEDDNHLLWIGTLDGGLYTFNRTSDSFTQFNSISGRNVFSIIEGSDNKLWIGTNGGINIVNQKTGKVVHHTMDYENPDSLISNSVFSIVKDDDETYWIGTWGALHHYIPAKGSRAAYFVRYTNNVNDSNSISNNIIRHVYNDPLNSNIWVSTMGGGLNRLIKIPGEKSVKFIQYKHNKSVAKSISSDEVNMVVRSKAGDLWIATNDGLNKLVPDKDPYRCSFVKFKEKDGLSGNHVQSVLEDAEGNLWIGTNNGLSKFDPNLFEFNNFDITDGLQSNEFSEHTCFINKSGEMFFGGVNGFNSFFADSIKKNTNNPLARITDFLIFNKQVPIGSYDKNRVILEKSITQTKEIVLSYRDNVFTIEFSALHFASPEKNKFAYKMEGFNDKWLYTDSKNRKATFTNLKGGTYIFKVKASNNDGYWQTKPTELKIKITPPIWKTWQFFILYILVIIIIIYAIIKEIKSKEELKSEIALKNIEKEKAEELNQMKLQFFTNISHEFRTPLTLIMAPIENLIDSIARNSFLKEQLVMMQRNAQYLLKLINEIMDFRKAETGFWKVRASKNDMVAFVQEVALTFENIAKKKHIAFQFQAENEEIEAWFDKELLVKVLNNLIHNAFKYTSEGGQIDVSIKKDQGPVHTKFNYKYELKSEGIQFDNYVSIKVSDNGIGISSQSIMDIFNRYYQVGSSDSDRHIGSGVGLALTKSLVLLSKGEIIVSSERNSGTEFIIRLPLGDSHLSDSEKAKDDIGVEPHTNYITDISDHNIGLTDNDYDMPESEDKSSAPLILVVEDNNDMRHFIMKNLKRRFRVLEAHNGAEGYEIATEKIPDLVVSDIIMPGTDGIQLCKKLKKDILTSHIPVVLLTALNSIDNQIEGLETGADEYISKPFNYKLFETRVDNLIMSRKRLRERFSKEIEIESKDFTLNWRDQEFLDKIIKIVQEKISEPNLSVENLSKNAGMSRIHFYRKITALTDQTPSEFIKTIRLKEAARLLAENRLTVSEIAYQVGFTAPSYFTTCFGKQFGLTPKEYLAQHAK